MMKKKKETTSQRVIIDNEIVSVSTLRKKAARANAVFWVACLLVALLSGMVVPYLSMASLSVSNSNAFTGEVIPGYSMGGIEVGAYAVDINSWGQVVNPTFTGSTYGVWNSARTDDARKSFNSGSVESTSSSVSNSQKSEVWQQVTGHSGFSESTPNGSVKGRDSIQYDTVAPYRTSAEITYFMSNTPSTSAKQNIQVTLYPDFVIFSYDGQHAHVLNNPDDSTVSSTGSMLNRDAGGGVEKTTAVPVYISISDLLDAFGLNTVSKDGDLVSLDLLMKKIGDEAKSHDGISPTLDALVGNDSKNLLAGTNYVNINGGTGETSDAFNPYPYSMVFQQSDDSGTLVTSSVYNNSEAYVYFSPESMYQAYIALKTEADAIANQASNEIAGNDPVTALQLGYYYAAMAVCEAYLTEALPQDMTRGYVGASEDTAPQVQRTTENGNKVGGDQSIELSAIFGKDPTEPKDFSKITYATLMYDVAHKIEDGEEWLLGNTNAIMNTLSVFGYDSTMKAPGTGVMKGMDATTTYRRLTAFTPYEKTTSNCYGDGKGSILEPDTLTSYTSGMYTAPYYPVQQHLMPIREKSFRFSLVSVIPYNTVTDNIAYNGLGEESYDIQTKLSYSAEFTERFKGVTDYMTKSKALVDQYQNSSDEDTSTSVLQQYEQQTDTDDNGKQVLILGNSSAEEENDQNEQQNMQKRVDSALMAYQSSTMDSDNVHDLCDVIRSVPGIKYETFMRFYNPLKSDGGDTDFFLTRVSPAMTDYFPVILNKGYENAGGEECNWGTSGVSFDYFSIPSFGPCFASHTASTTYYGSLNYELRAFFTKGFLETLSASTNIAVPQLSDYEDAQDEIENIENESDEQLSITKGNIRSLFILAKRILLARTFKEIHRNVGKNYTVSLELLNDDPNYGGDASNFPLSIMTEHQGDSASEWIHWATDHEDVVEGNASSDSSKDKWSSGKNLTFKTETLANILTGKSDLVSGDAYKFAKAVQDGEITSYTCFVTVELNPAGGGEALTPLAWGREENCNDRFAQFNFGDALSIAADAAANVPFIGGAVSWAISGASGGVTEDGSKQISWFGVDNNYINFYTDTQLLYNISYYKNVKSALFDESGEFYWDNIDKITDPSVYGEDPIGLTDYYSDGNGNNEATDIFTVAFNSDADDLLKQVFNRILPGKTWAEVAQDKAADVYTEQAKELSQEIFKDVLNIKKDMKLITDSMPSQMQNVLAWADYQNSSDSENQYQVDPSEANVTVNVGSASSSNESDDETESDDAILSKSDLEEYGWEWRPELNEGTGAVVKKASVGGTADAINDRESRMARGVAGATWTSTIQPACYTMTAVTGRTTTMNTNSDQQYPYYGIVNGRLQSGTDQYALLQSHVIDYSSIASGIAGDLEDRQRGNLLIINNSDSNLILDILNAIAAFFKELGISIMRFTGDMFEDLMFNNSTVKNTVDIKNVDNSADVAQAIDFGSIFGSSNKYTSVAAACTSSHVNMNRIPATASVFDQSTKSLKTTSSNISTAGAATTQIEQMGSQTLLTSGYGFYSIIQSIALALVMVFLLVIAFKNFISYSSGDSNQMIQTQMQLKTVLPRAIVAIFMIGLPSVAGGVGFQGGCYLLLQFLGSIVAQIADTFTTMSGGGLISSWVDMLESMDTMDLGALLVWLICSLVIAACFLIGCVVILAQSLILLFFWLIGPVVWAFYAWPYGTDPNDVSSKGGQQRELLKSANGIMWRMTQKMHIGAFTRGAIGNAAPTAWIWAYFQTALLTVIWSIIFWAMSLAISTVDLGSSATSTAATLGTGYDFATASIANAALFSMNQLGIAPFLQILIVTVLCVLIFWLMFKMMMNIFKNVPLNAAAVVPLIGAGIKNGLKFAGKKAGAAIISKATKTASDVMKDAAHNAITTENRKRIAEKAQNAALSLPGETGTGLANIPKNNGIQRRAGDIAKASEKRKNKMLSDIAKGIANDPSTLMDAKKMIGNVASSIANNPEEAFDALERAKGLKDKFDSKRDKLHALKDMATPYLSQAKTNFGDIFKGGIADKDRTGLYDMLDAHRMASTEKHMKDNDKQLETIKAAMSGVDAVRDAADQKALDNVIAGMNDDVRNMLEEKGVIRRNEKGEWEKDDTSAFDAKTSLIVDQTRLEKENKQLQKAHDIAERSLTARKTNVVNGELVTNTKAVENAKNHAQVYYDERDRLHLDEFQTIDALAAHYKQERDYKHGRLPKVDGQSVQEAMYKMNALDGMLADENQAYDFFDVNNASQEYGKALNGIVISKTIPAEQRNAQLVNIAEKLGEQNGAHVLSAMEVRALEEHVSNGGKLDKQQAKDLSFTRAVNAKAAERMPDEITLNRDLNTEQITNYIPSNTEKGAEIRDAQDKLQKRQKVDDALDHQFVDSGVLNNLLSTVLKDGAPGTELLLNTLNDHASTKTDAVNIIKAAMGDDRFNQQTVMNVLKLVTSGFDDMSNNEDLLASIADQVGISLADAKTPLKKFQESAVKAIKADSIEGIFTSNGMTNDAMKSVMSIIGSNGVSSERTAYKLDETITQKNNEITQSNDKISKLNKAIKKDQDDRAEILVLIKKTDDEDEKKRLQDEVKKYDAKIEGKNKQIVEAESKKDKAQTLITAVMTAKRIIGGHADEFAMIDSDSFMCNAYEHADEIIDIDRMSIGEHFTLDGQYDDTRDISRMSIGGQIRTGVAGRVSEGFDMSSNATQDNNDYANNRERRERESREASERMQRHKQSPIAPNAKRPSGRAQSGIAGTMASRPTGGNRNGTRRTPHPPRNR